MMPQSQNKSREGLYVASLLKSEHGQQMPEEDARAKTTAQGQIAEASRHVAQLHAYQTLANGVGKRRTATQSGLPQQLQSGIESLSGLAMHDVRVHYNSSKPAQLQAHAYAQGTDIHLAPGQERHLPHEAWHVVQQKQGRVKPTLQLKGVAINDDSALEREADVMGARAMGGSALKAGAQILPSQSPLSSSTVSQRVLKVGSSTYNNKSSVRKVLLEVAQYEESLEETAADDLRQMILGSEPHEFEDIMDLVKYLKAATKATDEKKDDAVVDATEVEEEEADASSASAALDVSAYSKIGTILFGEDTEIEDETVVVYRTVSDKELQSIASKIQGKEVIFTHKATASGGGEKFFAPNLAYLSASIQGKGDRRAVLKITLAKQVLQDLIYNAEYAGADLSAMGADQLKGLEKLKPQKHGIMIKYETPATKKGSISFGSYNIGFRNQESLTKLNPYILRIEVIAPNNKPNGSTVKILQ